MRGLAEYVMSGRRQAATVVVLFGLIPMLNLLSGAVVALVGLRKGPQEGFLMMMWALLPAGLQWLVGDTAPVIMVVGVAVLAYALRRTQSWPQVLLLATVIACAIRWQRLRHGHYFWQPAPEAPAVVPDTPATG